MKKAPISHGNYPDLPLDDLKNIYLDRYAWPGPQIKSTPKTGTKIIVVIPCFSEPDILESLQSLHDCENPGCSVEVIIVVNHGEHVHEKIKNFNIVTASAIEKWIISHENSHLSFHLICAYDLPKKHAGVGLARKIGMDEAVRRFALLYEKNGIIACFDADCLCTPNYLMEISSLYKKKPATNAGLFYFILNIHLMGSIQTKFMMESSITSFIYGFLNMLLDLPGFHLPIILLDHALRSLHKPIKNSAG